MSRFPGLLVALGVAVSFHPGGRATPTATASAPSRPGHPFGADRTQYLDEVLAPEVALRTGWQLHRARTRPAWQERYLAHRLGRLRVEVPGAPAGSYRAIAWPDLTLHHFLGNQAFVAGVLGDLARLAPGEEAVQQLGRPLVGRPETDLATLLAAYLGRHPEQAAAVGDIVRHRSYRVGTRREYQVLLRGGLRGA